MEREPRQQGGIKLTVVVGVDLLQASDILVSFPDLWELIELLSREEGPFYVAAMPIQEERRLRDRFYGLPPEINEALDTYRLYKLFQPWPLPQVNLIRSADGSLMSPPSTNKEVHYPDLST